MVVIVYFAKVKAVSCEAGTENKVILPQNSGSPEMQRYFLWVDSSSFFSSVEEEGFTGHADTNINCPSATHQAGS
jgi:hypothetical protein